MRERVSAIGVGFLSIAAFASPPEFAPFADVGAVPGFPSPLGPVVSLAEPPLEGERRAIEGRVTKVTGPQDLVYVVHVGRSKFEVGLPPKVKLPVRVGDDVRAEVWIAEGKWHARVSDARGSPLLFMNENPPGWTLELGVPAEKTPSKPPRQEREVVLRIGEVDAAHMYGWQRGSVDGMVFLVWGQAAVIDEARAQAMGLRPTWTRSIFSGVVRVR
ncbi:MAG: hypothetical protein Q8N23_20940 [Archangium sp.]|nr:hypothetical protein [Archangium sp.]MDP3572525.1 hypothetical protein [Archangium sp.]